MIRIVLGKKDPTNHHQIIFTFLSHWQILSNNLKNYLWLPMDLKLHICGVGDQILKKLLCHVSKLLTHRKSQNNPGWKLPQMIMPSSLLREREPRGDFLTVCPIVSWKPAMMGPAACPCRSCFSEWLFLL